MKKPLLIWVSALALLAVSATLFAQTTTGSSLITQMKAATHAFTLAADLNPGTTGLESSPLVGKRTGDMLSAGEYNRILELVGQGGGGGGGGSVKFHQANIPVSAGSVDLDSLLPSGYIAAFITSCWPSSNMDGLQIAYNTAVTTAWPNASCGAIMASPGVHIFGGGTWFKITGYLASGGGGGGGGSNWVDVPLTDTADFDVKCDYIFNWLRATFVHPEIIWFIKNEFDATSAASWYAVRKANKNTMINHQDNYANNTIYPTQPITSIKKNCGGGGGGTGGEAFSVMDLDCTTINVAGWAAVTATCPADRKVISGGCSGFVPAANSVPAANGWYCSNTSNNWGWIAYAVCCK